MGPALSLGEAHLHETGNQNLKVEWFATGRSGTSRKVRAPGPPRLRITSGEAGLVMSELGGGSSAAGGVEVGPCERLADVPHGLVWSAGRH